MDSFKTSLDTWLKHSLKTTKRYEIKNIMIKKIWVKIIAYVFIVHFFFLEILHWIWTSFFSFLMSLKIKKKNHQIYISIDFKLDFYWMICNFPLKNVQYKKGIFFLLKIANEWYEFHYQYEVMKMEEKKISQNLNITYFDCVTWTFTHLHFTHVKCNLQIFFLSIHASFGLVQQ